MFNDVHRYSPATMPLYLNLRPVLHVPAPDRGRPKSWTGSTSASSADSRARLGSRKPLAQPYFMFDRIFSNDQYS